MKTKKAQSLVEYSIVLALIVAIIMTMGPLIRRYLQGMIKLTTDQIGRQRGAEQSFDESGHLDNSYTITRALTSKFFNSDKTQYDLYDTTDTQTNAQINLGFSQSGIP